MSGTFDFSGSIWGMSPLAGAPIVPDSYFPNSPMTPQLDQSAPGMWAMSPMSGAPLVPDSMIAGNQQMQPLSFGDKLWNRLSDPDFAKKLQGGMAGLKGLTEQQKQEQMGAPPAVAAMGGRGQAADLMTLAQQMRQRAAQRARLTGSLPPAALGGLLGR